MAELCAEFSDDVDFGVEDVVGEFGGVDGVAEVTAREGMLVEEDGVVALLGEVIGGGQTGGSAADDGDGFGGVRAAGR